MARILLAGCGYVGLALAERLLAEGHEIWAIRRSPCPIPLGLRLVLVDLLDLDGLQARLPPEIDAVVYTAAADASDEASYRAAYLQGLHTLLSALLPTSPHLQRFLFASSTGVYSQTDGAWVDEDSPAEASHFSGRILLEGEAFLARQSFQTISVRFGGIYGPGRRRLIDSVLQQTARCPEGSIYTNRIHRDDCAGVLRHLLFLPAPFPCYLAVDDHPADTCEVLTWLARQVGLPPPPVSSEAIRSARTLRSNKRCSNQRLRASGYRFLFPSFREGYQAMLGSLEDSALPTSRIRFQTP